MDLWIF